MIVNAVSLKTNMDTNETKQSDRDTDIEKKIELLVKSINNKNITAQKIKKFLRGETESSSEEDDSFDDVSTTEESSEAETEVECNLEFQVVERGKRRKSASPPSSIKRAKKLTVKPNYSHTNKFNALANELDMEVTVDPPTAKTATLQPKPGGNNKTKTTSQGIKFVPPPIVCYKLNVAHLQRYIKGQSNLSEIKINNVNKSKTVLSAACKNTHEKLMIYLKEQKIDSYSYAFKDDKPVTAVLKGVHSSFSTEEVKEAIQLAVLNVSVIKVSRLGYKNPERKGQASNNYIVKLANGAKAADFTAIKFLLNQRVHWEKFKKNDIIQCFRCQNFGHTSFNCQMKIRCVKCNDTHEIGKCARTADEPTKPFCVNCGETGHPANYRGCPHHKQLVQKVRNKKGRKAEKAVLEVNWENKSYASTLKKGINNNITNNTFKTTPKEIDQHSIATPVKLPENKPATGKKNSHYSNNIDPNAFCTYESINLFGCDLFTLMNKINNFLPSYSILTNKSDRQATYLQFVFSLCAHNT